MLHKSHCWTGSSFQTAEDDLFVDSQHGWRCWLMLFIVNLPVVDVEHVGIGQQDIHFVGSLVAALLQLLVSSGRQVMHQFEIMDAVAKEDVLKIPWRDKTGWKQLLLVPSPIISLLTRMLYSSHVKAGIARNSTPSLTLLEMLLFPVCCWNHSAIWTCWFPRLVHVVSRSS